MSKVVTIPKDRNPFVVIVNGVKHSYPAGVTTEVPDEVADVIDKYEGAKPKPDPNAGINFGGAQSDWNQTDSSAADFIKNKPFGDELVEIMPETEVVGEDDGSGLFFITLDPTLFSGNANLLIVAFDGIEYSCNVSNEAGIETFGNLKLLDSNMADTGEPFLIIPLQGICATTEAGMHTMNITASVTQKINDKYINKQTVFYYGVNEQFYLYSDMTLSTKVSILQLVQAFESGHISLRGVREDAMIVMVYSTPVQLVLQEYAVHTFINSTSGGVVGMRLYAAEHPEPTT